jgi:hypothetical protein
MRRKEEEEEQEQEKFGMANKRLHFVQSTTLMKHKSRHDASIGVLSFPSKNILHLKQFRIYKSKKMSFSRSLCL